MRHRVQLKLDDTDRTDMSLTDTFRVMKALASKPQSPRSANPDRIERVAPPSVKPMAATPTVRSRPGNGKRSPLAGIRRSDR